MATPLSEVSQILDVLKSQDAVFSDNSIPLSFCKIGVIQASISLKKDFPMNEITNIDDQGISTSEIVINSPITNKEIYLAGLYAYRNYAVNTHDGIVKKAINFKTISFAVSGLTERAKGIMRIVWWCDTEIDRTLRSILSPAGTSSEFDSTP